jgi:preprotein translocase subunit SecA
MAGRGTDIMLGGNPEFMAVATLKQRGLDPEETPEEYEAAWDGALAQAEEAVQAEHDEVTDLGGLYVLGTERHESRRIDNQLRGRSGRQGDPGESRFYLSLQDDLMRLFNAAMVDRFMTTAKMDDEVPIESKMVSRSIQSAQGQVEGRNFEIRKNVLKYDDVLNRQRQVIYEERRRVLEGEDLHEQIRMFINDVVDGYIDAETREGYADDWDFDRLWTALKTLYPVSVTVEEIEELAGGRSSITADLLREQVTSDAHHAYDAREEQLGAEVMREVERRVVLSVLDRKWREHLYEMDYLQEGIGLRAMAQRDPLVEYQREGFQLFEAMNESIKEESVGYLFNVQVELDQPEPTAPVVQPVSVSDMLAGSGLSGGDGNQPVAAEPEPVEEPVDTLAPVGADAPQVQAGTAAVAEAHPTFRAKGLEQPQRRAQQLQYSAPSETGEAERRSAGTATATGTLTPEQLKGASRNGPCPCGSGKKFKMCHGRA